jgi:hypothetical protein
VNEYNVKLTFKTEVKLTEFEVAAQLERGLYLHGHRCEQAEIEVQEVVQVRDND